MKTGDGRDKPARENVLKGAENKCNPEFIKLGSIMGRQ